MDLTPIPAFDDNYIWCLAHNGLALVVDPGDAAPVRHHLATHGLRLAAIFVTHHHADHTGGVLALRAETGATVYGPAFEDIAGIDHALDDGDTLHVLGVAWSVHHVPGHTAGHIAFVGTPSGQAPILFCGDTLFSGGCGRLFEGTPAQMLASLDTLSALPDSTRVCCAHEYTLSNLAFAQAVEPGNADLQAHAQWAHAQRQAQRPTLPTALGTEKRINPFLRSRAATVRQRLADRLATDPTDADAFGALREWKNTFR